MNDIPVSSTELTAQPTAPHASPPETEANDFKAISKALDDAGGVVLGLWISFISFEAYLAIAVGSVTHQHLLFEKPLTLPIINVSVPLVAFFWLAPILFLLFHFYLLLQIVMLADVSKRYNDVLATTVEDPGVRRNLRLQLPKNIFVQILAAPRDIREGMVGAMLRIVVWTTAVLGPILLLLLVQLQFLPYHSEAVTWLQRIAILIDLAMVWLLWWPVSVVGEIRFPPPAMREWGLIGCATVAVFSVTLAVFPGEYAHRLSPLVRWTSIYDLIFNGDVDEVTRRRNSIFSSTLVLPDVKFVKNEDIEKLDKAELASEVFPGTGAWVLNLRGRDLNGAVFSGADLRRTDFTGARLNGANFSNAKLSGSTFTCPALEDRALDGCGLDRSKFDSAQIDGVYFSTSAKSASFYGANAQGAVFSSAQLQGANLTNGHFEGAAFPAAKLQGAQLSGASFQGAAFNSAELQGVWAERTDFSAAMMDQVQLQGANLVGSNFRAASLYRAAVHGANLSDSVLEGTNLTQAMLWRVRIDSLATRTDRTTPLGAKTTELRSDDIWFQPTAGCFHHMTDADAEQLKQLVLPNIDVSDYVRRIYTEGAFDRLKQTPDFPDDVKKISSIDRAGFDDIRQQTIVDLVCARSDSTILSSRSIARRLVNDWTSIDHKTMITQQTADLLLKSDTCPVDKYFEKNVLNKLRNNFKAMPDSSSGDFEATVLRLLYDPCVGTKPIVKTKPAVNTKPMVSQDEPAPPPPPPIPFK